MLDLLKERLASVAPPQKLNVLREYLQLLILEIMDGEKFGKLLAFTGGTALRLVYKNRRFSEDLGFSLMEGENFSMNVLAAALKKRLLERNLKTEISQLKENKTVGSVFLKFEDLLYPLGLAPNSNQKLAIKLEVDRNPPRGSRLQEFLFQEPFLFALNHLDLPSLYSGKLNAFLLRKYDKGRDYYDLTFFFGKKVRPNFPLFFNGVQRTHPEKKYKTPQAVYLAVEEKIKKMNHAVILKDLRPFLEVSEETRLMTADALLNLLQQNKELFK